MKRLVVGILGVAIASLSLAAQGAQTPRLAAPAPKPAIKTATPKPAVSHSQAPAAPSAPSSMLDADAQTALVKQYCATCHSERGKAGGLSLASFDAAKAVESPVVAEKVIHKLRLGMMPPPGARRPEGAVLTAFAESLETRLDRAAAVNPNPGRRPFQRMNRAEYARAIKSLLDLDIDVAQYLPPDTISHGFDNVADVQTLSPTLMEGYLRAASQISRLALGDRNATATSTTYKLGRTMSQMRHVEGTPIGTRGGTAVTHVFPADGDYVFKVAMHYEPLGGLYGRSTMTMYGINEQVEVSVDGERVAVLDLNTRMSESDPKNNLEPRTPPIHVSAGPHKIAAAFIEKIAALPDDLLIPVENTLVDVSIAQGITVLPHMRDFTVIGPSAVTGISDTPSRRRIFTCRPTTSAEEAPCAEEIIKRVATQAFRGPITADEFKGVMAFYDQGRKRTSTRAQGAPSSVEGRGDFESGVRLALQAILASPRFVFRFEEAPPSQRFGEPRHRAETGVAPVAARSARAYRVNDFDLASRLAFFLWATVPDAELLKVASQGTLKTPLVLEKQVRRMLADPKAEALATRFASQWLRLQDLDKLIPDYLQYPNYDDTLAHAFKRETQLFFESLVREDRPVLDLLTADYSFVNERVARHYGIANVAGPEFRRVQLPEHRRGLLGHGSILALTSNSDRTSPVQRGKWVMEVLLASPPPPPPPNVPSLDDTKPTGDGKFLSVRERMEEHRKNPACTSCHRVIDPLGVALENFDVTGAWRIKDNEVHIDSAGELYDGTKMDGPAGLRNALLKHKDAFLLSFTENLMTYGLGRRVEYYDMPAVRQIVRDAAKHDYRMSAFFLSVVKSAAFQMSAAEAVERTSTTTDRHERQ
jgi:mono/diheme cytochrome c family protein